jgi:hypothetical protein
MKGLPKVDLFHFDIQGREEEAISSAIEAMNTQVKGIVVGTHGPDIEQALCQLMERHHWCKKPFVRRFSVQTCVVAPQASPF